jgi:hypothetical protein
MSIAFELAMLQVGALLGITFLSVVLHRLLQEYKAMRGAEFSFGANPLVTLLWLVATALGWAVVIEGMLLSAIFWHL